MWSPELVLYALYEINEIFAITGRRKLSSTSEDGRPLRAARLDDRGSNAVGRRLPRDRDRAPIQLATHRYRRRSVSIRARHAAASSGRIPVASREPLPAD